MARLVVLLRFGLAAMAALFCVVALYGLAINPAPAWTAIVVVVLLIMLVAGVALVFRRPDGPFFEPLLILLPCLTVGRLLSTVWLVPEGQPAPKMDELILGETGPGIAYFEPLSLAFVGAVSLYVVAQARRSIAASPGVVVFTSSDWLVAVLRVYVALMFVSHFTGHVLAGPIPFAAFVDYFGHVGMPFPPASVVLAGLIEIAVCTGLAFGFLTRPLAALGAFYLLFAVGIGGHFAIGYSWALPGLGWEFPALWAFAIAIFGIFGAGPISLDAKLGWRISIAG